MGEGHRLIRFGTGGLLGAAIGTAVGILFAPQSGDELKGRLTDRIRQAKLAGAEAAAAKEEELIRKFRTEVNDPGALQGEASKTQLEASHAVAALGLGLNAPGLLAAQETILRASAQGAPHAAPFPATAQSVQSPSVAAAVDPEPTTTRDEAG